MQGCIKFLIPPPPGGVFQVWGGGISRCKDGKNRGSNILCSIIVRLLGRISGLGEGKGNLGVENQDINKWGWGRISSWREALLYIWSLISADWLGVRDIPISQINGGSSQHNLQPSKVSIYLIKYVFIFQSNRFFFVFPRHVPWKKIFNSFNVNYRPFSHGSYFLSFFWYLPLQKRCFLCLCLSQCRKNPEMTWEYVCKILKNRL